MPDLDELEKLAKEASKKFKDEKRRLKRIETLKYRIKQLSKLNPENLKGDGINSSKSGMLKFEISTSHTPNNWSWCDNYTILTAEEQLRIKDLLVEMAKEEIKSLEESK